jgi:hypothetical protein
MLSTSEVSPKENGLVLEVPEIKKSVPCSSKTNGKIHATNPFKPVPQALKKNPWSGQSGARATTLKQCYVSSLVEIEGKQAKIGRTVTDRTTEEIIPPLSEPSHQ